MTINTNRGSNPSTPFQTSVGEALHAYTANSAQNRSRPHGTLKRHTFQESQCNAVTEQQDGKRERLTEGATWASVLQVLGGQQQHVGRNVTLGRQIGLGRGLQYSDGLQEALNQVLS